MSLPEKLDQYARNLPPAWRTRALEQERIRQPEEPIEWRKVAIVVLFFVSVTAAFALGRLL